MKYLLVLLVVVIGLWALFGRGRRPSSENQPAPAERPVPPSAVPARMVACAHCGVHLPMGEALMDAAGRPYCADAHRLAGPR